MTPTDSKRINHGRRVNYGGRSKSPFFIYTNLRAGAVTPVHGLSFGPLFLDVANRMKDGGVESSFAVKEPPDGFWEFLPIGTTGLDARKR